MKKLTMIAAVLAAMTFSAVAADVYSSNIVGYTKLTLQPGLNMIGGAFVQVGTGGQLAVNDMFAGAPTAGPSSDQADFIQTWSNDGVVKAYGDKYFFYAEDGSDPNDPPEGEFMWYDRSDDNTEMDLAMPEGVWYYNYSGTATELSLIGQCPTNETVTLTLQPGLNMISMPYPVAIGLNSVYFDSSNCNAGPSSDQADFIQTWSNDGVTKAYGDKYFFYAEDGSDPNDPPEGEFMWYDRSDDNTEMDLPIANGFWYYNYGASDITVTITRPYDL